MFEDKTRCPLTWPENWPRTNPGSRTWSRFGDRTVNVAFQFLLDEIYRLGSDLVIISTNIPRSQKGGPISNYKQPNDPGVAAYFKWNNRPVTLACDKWLKVEENMWAIAKHIEALRGQERWGVGTLEQAFRGYMALPGVGQTSGENWWMTLGVPINATEDRIKSAFRLLAKKHHPDIGGDRELWERINRAYQQAESMFNHQ